jgi:hypothetical protein
MDKGDRVITFFNGMTARERLVTIDDQTMRLDNSVVEVKPTNYNGSVEIIADSASKCRLIWTIDLLPNELGPMVAGMMDHAAPFMKKTLEAA